MNNTEIQKPITMLKDEFSNKLAQLINESGLPPFIIEYELRSIFEQIHSYSVQQAIEEKKKYEEEVALHTSTAKKTNLKKSNILEE